jgi:hypothetical protein
MDRSTPIYVPTASSLSFCDNWNRWEIVRGALEDEGWTDIRPAPMPSLNFIPRQLRPGALARG